MNSIPYLLVFFCTFFTLFAHFSLRSNGKPVKLDPNITEMFLWMGGAGILVLVVMFVWTMIPRDKKNK